MENGNDEIKKSRVWLKFSSLGLQMGLTIYFAHLIGDWMDNDHPMKGVNYNKTFTILAVFGSTYSIIRQVIKMSNEEDNKKKKWKEEYFYTT